MTKLYDSHISCKSQFCVVHPGQPVPCLVATGSLAEREASPFGRAAVHASGGPAPKSGDLAVLGVETGSYD